MPSDLIGGLMARALRFVVMAVVAVILLTIAGAPAAGSMPATCQYHPIADGASMQRADGWACGPNAFERAPTSLLAFYVYDGALHNAPARPLADDGPITSQRVAGVNASPSVRPVGAIAASVVAAETEVGAAPRFIGNSAGDILDPSRVSIPEGKFGYLLENPSKAGVFSDSMGFDKAGLDSALRSHLIDNFGSASESVPMFGSGGAQIGTKFTVTGPLTGPSGATWNITSAWGVDWDGTIRLITATP